MRRRVREAGPPLVEADDAPGTHPVFYIKNHGAGAVLYLTLGHCRGHYDLQPKEFILGWTYERIMQELGPINFYVNERRDVGEPALGVEDAHLDRPQSWL